jgi:translation initiation factor IF-3
VSGRRDDRRRRPQARINEGIRARQLRLIAADGEQLGIKTLREALAAAEAAELDLVQVSDGDGQMPVCKLMDYSKHLFQEQKRQREARKHAAKNVVKQVRLRPKIAEHDYETKKNHARKFLEQGAAVLAQVLFRGRENTHPEIGVKLLERLIADCADLGKAGGTPSREGRALQVVISPLPKKQ